MISLLIFAGRSRKVTLSNSFVKKINLRRKDEREGDLSEKIDLIIPSSTATMAPKILWKNFHIYVKDDNILVDKITRNPSSASFP